MVCVIGACKGCVVGWSGWGEWAGGRCVCGVALCVDGEVVVMIVGKRWEAVVAVRRRWGGGGKEALGR